ncbi:MAG: hypothetical protein LBM98_07095 [Oscillospiraceae bacterium]|nr:hypothetical protein [Oscillospiraceae bacterium]
MRSTGKPAIRRTLQVRSNPVPGGQHTSQRILGTYVNPGLLRRISSVRIASAVAASQRRCAGGRTTGRAKPRPVPAQCAGTVDGVTPRTARGGVLHTSVGARLASPGCQFPPVASFTPVIRARQASHLQTATYIWKPRNPRPNPRL